MKPYVICHMLSSLDGKIDPHSLREIARSNEYESIGAMFSADAWICGRETMQQHFAEKNPFVSLSHKPAGPQPVFVARRAESYAISIDTHGKLCWSSDEIAGDHLICIISEQAPEDYLAMLKQKGISYIVAGQSTIDLAQAVSLLDRYFGIGTLLLEGGGHINGAFLEANLVDEISLLIVPGVDGRHDVPSVFDGIPTDNDTAFPLELKSVERRDKDTLWIRYNVKRDETEKRSSNAEAQTWQQRS